MEKNMTVDAKQGNGLEARKLMSRITELSSIFSLRKMFNSFKARRALPLLRTTDFKISQIAYIVGFDSEEELRAVFVAKYGLSPERYRLQEKIV